MPIYVYRAETGDNKIVIDQLEAMSLDHAATLLLTSGMRIINLREQSNGHIFEKKVKTTFGIITKNDIFMLTRYFAIFQKSGISVLRSLEILKKRTQNSKLKAILASISADVSGGRSLNYAFNKHSDAFDRFYVSMIKIGEESGNLYQVLDRLAVRLEKQLEMRRKIMGLLTYPIVLAVSVFFICSFFLVNILPKFQAFFNSLSIELPPVSKFVMEVSLVTRAYYPLIPAFGLFFFAAFKAFISTKSGRMWWDRFKLKIPILGKIIVQSLTGDLFRNISLLYESGYTVTDAFKLSVMGMENTYFSECMTNAVEDIESGITISESLLRTGILAEIALDMVMVGEETGKFDMMIQSISDYYEKEIDFTIQTGIRRIEPFFLLFFGIIVLVLLLAIYMPIFSSGNAIPL
jgi:MSHA biogenesis protein MshG